MDAAPAAAEPGLTEPRFFRALTKPQRAKLAKLGITRAFDLVLHLPLRYEDETQLCSVRELPFDRGAQTEGELVSADIEFRPRRQLVCQLSDGQDLLHLRFLNFYPSQLKQLQPGVRLRVVGQVREGHHGPEMVHPRYRVVNPDTPLSTELTPIYPTTATLSQTELRRLVTAALDQCNLADSLPHDILRGLGLPEFGQSARTLHNPSPDIPADQLGERSHPAWRRLKFDELLAQQLSMRLSYRARREQTAPVLEHSTNLPQTLLRRLPFQLTGAQRRAMAEITGDLAQSHPMQRLLQGDVGSGKTIVAAYACAQAIGGGFQAALMAPTEILAEQHFHKIEPLLAPLGVSTAWLSGSQKKREQIRVLQNIESGGAQFIVGTHALFQERVKFHRLGLVVIDEQHRFGVGQRLALRLKGADQLSQPHQLMMSATPIPRTLSMTYFADLDVSVLDELPPGRRPIVTKLVSDGRRGEVFERIRAACREGAQAYWVCPLIEESDALQLQTANETFARLESAFPELRMGLVHGRLPAAEKAQAMERFQRGEIQLLVATTVIEVGVDVPNATLMVIENAERMGLSQLHQLRGRVGRGTQDSACILLYQNPLSDNARARLKIIFENNDGFEIARQDLRLRGPGEFLGARQSGLPMLRFADLELDLDLLEQARNLAPNLIENHPAATQRHLDRWLGGKSDLLRV